MIDRINISRFDIKVSQIMTWAFTLSFLIVSTIIILYSFTLNGLLMMILILLITLLINYASAKMWNIWYEEGFLIFQNIYGTRKVPIAQFKQIEMTSVFNNAYTIYMNNGEKYTFRIKMTEDLKLFFKNDSQFYAKQITSQLNDIKANSSK